MPEAFIELGGLGVEGREDAGSDWLILALKDPSQQLAAYPLRPRRQPVQVGERVFLLGCPYTEPDCKQNVYTGTVTQRENPGWFRYDLDPPVELPGFSGAPIVDAGGYAVGVVTLRFVPKMAGDKYLEGGGEDVALVLSQMERPH